MAAMNIVITSRNPAKIAAAYILLNLLADVMGILSNPRLLHPK